MPSLQHRAAAAAGGIDLLVVGLFQEFEARRLRWAVLRNAEGLPHYTRNDIDLLVDDADMERAEAIVCSIAVRSGWGVVAVTRKHGYRCVLLQNPNGEPRYLPIDLVSRCSYRVWPIVRTSIGLEHRRKRDELLWVVPAGFESAFALMKELLARGHIRDEVRASIAAGAAQDPDTFGESLEPILGPALTQQLWGLSRDGNWVAVASAVGQVRRKVCRIRPGLIPSLAAYGYVTFKHYLHPPLGLVISLVGPDGSGKTTIAEQVSCALYKKPFRFCKHVPMNIGVLPTLSAVARGLRMPGQRHLRPAQRIDDAGQFDETCELPAWRSMLYITWYGLDMMLGRLVLRRWRGLGALVIFARHFDDYYFQYAHRRTPRRYIDFVRSLVPDPDIVIFLKRDPLQIFADKPELSVKELRRQQSVLDDLIGRRSNAETVIGDNGVEDTVRQVVNLIERKLSARNEP